MNSLYFILLIGSAFVPLVLSFDKKLQFYKQWKYLLPSIITIAVLYILFDIISTNKGGWGFNSDYHSSLLFFDLPLEEYLFFIIIPYASIFLHDSIALYFNKFKLSKQQTKAISACLIVLSVGIILFNIQNTYTVYVFIKIIAVLIFSLFDKSELMNRFYLTFLIILIPFGIVNGILTGSFISEPVVWYNNAEILGVRIFTIPVEDIFYAFSLIAFVLLLRIKIKSNFS